MQIPFRFFTTNQFRRPLLTVALASSLMLQSRARAQPETGPARAVDGPAGTMMVDNFEGELDGWMAVKLTAGKDIGPDEDAQVAITHDEAYVKNGQGALSYSYRLDSKAFHALALPRPFDLSQMNSVQFWLRTNVSTGIVFGLHDSTNLNEQTFSVSEAGQWHHLAFNLDQLRPFEPNTPADAKLNPTQIQALFFADLANALPDYLRSSTKQGVRVLWLDDVEFSPTRLPPTMGLIHHGNSNAFLIDNFETAQIRWIPVDLDTSQTPMQAQAFASPVEIDDKSFHSGQSCLKLTYSRGPGRLSGLLRNLDSADYPQATGVSLWLKTESAGSFLVILEKKNGARYQCPIAVDAHEWTQFRHSLDDFVVSPGSHDDDGVLEASQIKDLTVADVTGLDASALPAAVEAHNSLWLDDVEMSLPDQG